MRVSRKDFEWAVSGGLRALRYAVVFVAAFVAGMAGALSVLPMELEVPMNLVWPLTLGVMALAAALCAGWVSNLLALGTTWSRLLIVVLVAQVAALFLDLISLLLFTLLPLIAYEIAYELLPPLTVAVVALAATVAAWRYRRPEKRLLNDILLTLALLALAVLIVAGTVGLACSVLLRCIP